jgi:hypothetical protein
MTFCDTCLLIYTDTYIAVSEQTKVWKCPQANCSGALVTVDEMIAPVIRELYRKSYTIVSCCSSHAHLFGSFVYIKFTAGIEFETAPKDFELLTDENSAYIRKQIGMYNDLHERQLHIFKAINALMVWVNELDDYY